MTAVIIVIMGVAGAGKSTVGKLLAGELGCAFLDADSLHAPANVDKMATIKCHIMPPVWTSGLRAEMPLGMTDLYAFTKPGDPGARLTRTAMQLRISRTALGSQLPKTGSRLRHFAVFRMHEPAVVCEHPPEKQREDSARIQTQRHRAESRTAFWRRTQIGCSKFPVGRKENVCPRSLSRVISGHCFAPSIFRI